MNALTTTTTTSVSNRLFDVTVLEREWQNWIADRADTTQAGYNVTVRAFLEWLTDNGITAPGREHIISYRQWLATPHKSRKTGEEITFSADTIARYFRGCKMFFRFLEAKHLWQDVTKDVRTKQISNANTWKRDSLEREDVLRILESIDTSTEKGKRDYAIVLTCVSCGTRIIELQRANIGDIETHAGERRFFIQGKGHGEKDDYKKIEPELWEALDDYLTTRGTRDKDAPLFSAVDSNAKKGGGRLTEPSISRIVKDVLKNAGYDSSRITAHSLRHTSITLLRQSGGSLEEAKRHARHSSIVITQRYDHTMEKAKAKDERRILDYLFTGNANKTPEDRATELLAKMPADKREQAIQLLEALAI